MSGLFDHLPDLLLWNETRGSGTPTPQITQVRGTPGIYLEHDSDYLQRSIPNNAIFNDAYEPFSADELGFAHSQLQQALEKIFATDSKSLVMIEQSLRCIGIRKSSITPTLHGLTRSERLGAVLLRNPHGLKTGITELSEAIVHESLHSYILLLERRVPIFLANRQAMIDRMVASPWTGKRIEVYAYFHAIAVWFCLARFLGSLPEQHTDDWIQRRLMLIRNGFAKMDQEPYAELNRLTELEPSFARSIHRMIELIRSSPAPASN
jgi:hypothetical protein